MAMDLRPDQGLSAREAALRLRQFGPNELPSAERRNVGRIIWDIIRQPMFALLLAGAAIYFLLGEALDATVLSLFATLSVSISVLQEGRSERVLESLRNLASPRALVLRDGQRQRIPARDLVPGDTIILVEGDRVPADALLLSGDEVLADESLLTGESVPVQKIPSRQDMSWMPPGGEDLPFVYAGTLVVRGPGTARVIATGLSSELGKIGQTLKSVNLEQPRLQKQLQWLVRDFAGIGTLTAALVVLLLGFTRGSWLQAALAGIAIGMSVLPEEIPLVLTVFMAMGAWRISRAGVLTRRAAAIETLGAATVLCTDKTGTLTENKMQVELIAADGVVWRKATGLPLQETMKATLHAALGASDPVPTDPMDKAVHAAASQAELVRPASLLGSYGLLPDLPATTFIWNASGEFAAVAYAKGAPEAIAELCKLSGEARERLLHEVDDFAARGVRVLGVAQARLSWQDGSRPRSQREIDFRYVGLIGFADPLRPEVPAAVRECQSAGIRVVMITGDYPLTAKAIAAQAGIDAGEVLDGATLETLSDPEIAEAVKTTSTYARIRPQQKL
ncbi:MAG TPA: HAD-IC family P-type ATPase, partial [Bryobacteraceae bacterium]|nr:HAD-IC family P-type ATPase [Bryobacteraceae bacterium]